jgi:hypothetical protein
LTFREPDPNEPWTIHIGVGPKSDELVEGPKRGRIKRCVNCGREDTRGYSRLSGARRYESGEDGHLVAVPAPALWVCRRGFRM